MDERSEKIQKLVRMDNFSGIDFLKRTDNTFKYAVDELDQMAGDSFCGALRTILAEVGINSRIVDYGSIDVESPVPMYAVLSYTAEGTPDKLYMLTPTSIKNYEKKVHKSTVGSFNYPKFAVIETYGDIFALYRISGSKDYEVCEDDVYIINTYNTGNADLCYWREVILANL